MYCNKEHLPPETRLLKQSCQVKPSSHLHAYIATLIQHSLQHIAGFLVGAEPHDLESIPARRLSNSQELRCLCLRRHRSLRCFGGLLVGIRSSMWCAGCGILLPRLYPPAHFFTECSFQCFHHSMGSLLSRHSAHQLAKRRSHGRGHFSSCYRSKTDVVGCHATGDGSSMKCHSAL